ncbi:mechanosensitive ion channel family protein [Lichenihabitans sp. Uapishka_5]|uniref:mechanosensitive ion channel family protein n=1 Tax=Lichenihabitans sp. Uapishka_5 TaxID=3037302 RepID=UPI0029E7FE7E|nr:mechanosensitive ion channel family protein [Lichenihabitans sp. Uapishka_5]MDX7953539.1 mechanosensitive ion channel family protein [Lichenihabitans sp. Uapishka_5]
MRTQRRSRILDRVRRWGYGLLTLATLSGARPALGADGSAAAATLAPDAGDPKIRQFLDLLVDPAVRRYLEQSQGTASHAEATHRPDVMSVSLAARLDALRQHLGDLLRSSHEFPSQAHMAHEMAVDAAQSWGGLSITLAALAVFVAMGYGAQALFHLIGKPFRRWLLALTLDAVDERVRAVFARSLYGIGLLASFALGSIGAFLLFDWPSLIKELLLAYLLAFVSVRLATILGRFLLAPGAERFRVVPVPTPTAWFLYLRLVAFMIVLAFGNATIEVLSRFGLSDIAAELGRDCLGLALMAMACEAIWRMPRSEPIEAGDGRLHRHRLRASLLTVACAVLWLCWVAQARTAFWLVAFATGLPIITAVGRMSVLHILRPAGAGPDGDARSLQALLFEHGVRSFVLIGAALALAWIFGVDLASLTMEDTLTTRLVRAAVSVAVIVLGTEFLWTTIRAVLDRKMRQPIPTAAEGFDAGHAARMQTLLPIVSNILLAALALVAAMMVLGALGVQIGPLIASAGVVGVAIGFGAQTLVKDVISGIFYLVDDAFRIGEYIQSGSYKGTVESFSLRSVKLRHQRGALYTIPFGSLGAVQNQSRDWVVDKIVLNVPYGTDLERVRKLIKKIGIDLTEDADFGADILSPLKMQGVAQFGDYAIQIQTKMMTRPGDAQFAARRRALLMIKQAFETNNIGFAVPTVQVSGDVPQGAGASALMAVSRRAAAEDAGLAG